MDGALVVRLLCGMLPDQLQLVLDRQLRQLLQDVVLRIVGADNLRDPSPGLLFGKRCTGCSTVGRRNALGGLQARLGLFGVFSYSALVPRRTPRAFAAAWATVVRLEIARRSSSPVAA